MPATFTKSFAERLNRLCAPQVQEATDGARLEIGRIYLAPGGERHLTIANAHAPCCRLIDKPPVNALDSAEWFALAGHIDAVAQGVGAEQRGAGIVAEDIDQRAGIDRIDRRVLAS